MPRHAARPTRITAALALGLALGLAACGGSGATPRPSPSASAIVAPATLAPSDTPPPSGGPTPPAPTKVPGGNDHTPAPSPGLLPDEAWGAAWDALPPGFPVPANATPADPGDPADGPVSGAFVADGSPDDVVNAMQKALAAAGYSTEALSGPSEDGSLVLDSIGTDPACRVQTTVRPLGGTTMITVLYGAACPWG